MLKSIVAVLMAGLALAGCTTTEEAAMAVRAKWIGQPVDRFFVENGPPVSSYALDAGGMIYTWRGGETSYTRPAQYQTRTAFGPEGRPVRRATITTMVQPAQEVPLLCEAQLTTDKRGMIQAVRINRDTEGEGLSLSRCAEIFGDE